MNERQDYFGQTVNIASRVQDLANAQAIFVTGAVVNDNLAADLLQQQGADARVARCLAARH